MVMEVTRGNKWLFTVIGAPPEMHCCGLKSVQMSCCPQWRYGDAVLECGTRPEQRDLSVSECVSECVSE